jgi:hypothetical protein
MLTELDARVLLADLVTLVVGEEHVCRETALGHVGVCVDGQQERRKSVRNRRQSVQKDLPFFFLPSLVLRVPRVVVFSLGILLNVWGLLIYYNQFASVQVNPRRTNRSDRW